MAKKLISEILSEASKIEERSGRVEFLKKHDCPALRDILRINFDDDIVSALPSGEPPYRKDDAPKGYEYKSLHREFKQLGRFFKGPLARQVSDLKRESMFISLLESLNVEEAELLVLSKDKELKYRGITKKLVSDVWPNLIKK
jgi:hypothetical protein